MALDRRDVILAGLASFVAWGFATHWLPGLRFAGHGLVAGVLLTLLALLALILLSTHGPAYRKLSRTSSRPDGVAFIACEKWPEELAGLRRRQVYKKVQLYDESPRISRAIDDLLELISRDFIRSWYSKISPNPVFSNEVDRTIRLALTDLRDRLFQIDLAEALTSRFVPILTAHFRDFYDAERSVRGRKLNRAVTESEELDIAIASKYRDGKLHPAASLSYSDTKTEQQEYLRRKLSTILPEVLPEKFLASRPVATIIREIVACAILFPVMQMLSDPDTWNQIMENYVCYPSRYCLHVVVILTLSRRAAACSRIGQPSKSSGPR